MIKNGVLKTMWEIRSFLFKRLGLMPALFGAFWGAVANAQTPPTLPGLPVTDVNDVTVLLICSVAYYMFWILIGLSTVFVIVAAYKYLTSQGDETKVGSATKTLTYAAVAVVVALLASGFPAIVASVFGGTAGASCP